MQRIHSIVQLVNNHLLKLMFTHSEVEVSRLVGYFFVFNFSQSITRGSFLCPESERITALVTCRALPLALVHFHRKLHIVRPLLSSAPPIPFPCRGNEPIRSFVSVTWQTGGLLSKCSATSKYDTTKCCAAAARHLWRESHARASLMAGKHRRPSCIPY